MHHAPFCTPSINESIDRSFDFGDCWNSVDKHTPRMSSVHWHVQLPGAQAAGGMKGVHWAKRGVYRGF